MDKKHTCDFCNNTYASASSKSTHIKKFHKNIEEKEKPIEKVEEIPVEKKKVQKKKIKVQEKVQTVEEKVPVEENKNNVEEKAPVEEKKIKIKKSKKIIPKFEKCDDCEECFDNREELFVHIVRNHKTEDIYKVFNFVSSDPNITEEDQELINKVGKLYKILNEISETAINYKKKVEENLKKDLKEDPETTKELIYNHIKMKYGNKITEIMDERDIIMEQIARNFYQKKFDEFVIGGLIYTL
jgi:hypothetical protein